jgi:hypothetical protein
MVPTETTGEPPEQRQTKNMKTEKTETVIDRLEQHIADECTRIDREAQFDAMLDECYSFDKVGGPFAHMLPSRVLKELDPVAYRCGVNDYEDSCEWVEVGGEYYDGSEADKAKDEFVDNLESEISDLEAEIETEEADEYHNVSDVAAMKRKLADLRADLATVEKHSF